MINAVSNARVPHLTVNIGASYGAGNYGMCGRAYDPRFLFAWPNAKIGGHGPEPSWPGCCPSWPARRPRPPGGRSTRRPTPQRRQAVEAQIEAESLPCSSPARLYDDGIIDPRDTRTVLGMCPVGRPLQPGRRARRGFGVFRM